MMPPAAGSERALRVYVSRRTYRVLGGTAAALLAASLLAAIFSGGRAPGPQLAWVLLGSAVALLVLVKRMRVPDEECALCGRPRAAVKYLVAAPHVSICEECASLSAGVVGEELGKAPEKDAWLGQLVRVLPWRCPFSVSRPWLEALAPGGCSTAQLHDAVTQAFRLHNMAIARELLERIPERERTDDDWLNLGVALGRLGRPADALAATSHARGEAGRPWRLNNDVFHEHQLHPDAGADVRRRWLTELDEARRLLTGARPAGWQMALRSCYGTEAALRLTMHEPGNALVALHEAAKLGAIEGERRLIRARALAAIGQRTDARAEAELAMEELHPESREADAVRAFLSGLGE